MKDVVMQYFIVLMIHGTGCPNCPDKQAYPVYIQVPSLEICMQVKERNPDMPAECWAKPTGEK
jgi:hypothetical protein